MDARQAAQSVLEAGKSGELSAALAAIAEATAPGGAPKYPPRVCRELARIVACRNYAKSVLQLCHLVNAADACARRNESYERLLLGVPQALPRHFRDHLSAMLAANGWRRPGFSVEPAGIVIAYDDSEFRISYSRMPLLASLLEFIVGMEGYTAIDDIFTGMLGGAASAAAIGDAANTISRRVYAYLSDNLPSAQNMAKFNCILEFLSARAEDGEVNIDDPAILEFWRDNSFAAAGTESGFRTYRSVLDAFIAFMQSLELAGDRQQASHAAPIGGDAESGEIDPESLYGLMDVPGQWQSPLPLLEDEPAVRVKFLTGRERDALRLMMEMGPLARALPLSLLRAECFGPAQARLTQAMRRNAAPDKLQSIAALDDLTDYPGLYDQFERLHGRVNKAMLASLHVLLRDRAIAEGGNIAALPDQEPASLFQAIAAGPDPAPMPAAEEVLDEAARAFNAIARRGFAEADLEEAPVVEAFRTGAGILQAIAGEIESFLGRLTTLNREKPGLSGQFSQDRDTFANQFKCLYGVSS